MKKKQRLPVIVDEDASSVLNRDVDRSYAFSLVFKLRKRAQRLAQTSKRDDWRRFGRAFERAFGKVEERIYDGLPYVRLLLHYIQRWEEILRVARRPLVKSGLALRLKFAARNRGRQTKAERRRASLQSILSTSKRRTKKSIADELQVSVRQLNRDLKKLK
jgi:hypothetical protein